MDAGEVRRVLESRAGMTGEQADVFAAVTAGGRMAPRGIAAAAGLGEAEARAAAEALVGMGALIDMPGGTFEAMHPRFAVVNACRRRCEARGEAFGRDREADAAAAALEPAYERARAK